MLACRLAQRTLPIRRGYRATYKVVPSVRCMAMSGCKLRGPGSDKLASKSCGGACSKDTPKITDDDLPDLMLALPSWELNDSKTLLSKKFIAKNFVAAVDFFNKVKDVAEQEGHHPDLHLTNFRDVEVCISTHAVGGLTYPDFVLAAKLDMLEVEYSPKWLKQQQEKLQLAGQ